MGNFRKSVPKPAPGSGAPRGKNPLLKVVNVNDIAVFPPSNVNGVLMEGNLVLKPGKKAEDFYATDDMQKFSHALDGEADAEGFLKKAEASHPGDSLEVNEFVQNNIGEPFIIFYPTDCEGTEYKVLGTKCNPMYIKGADFSDDKDGLKHVFTFEQRRRDRLVAKFYTGVIPSKEAYSPVAFALALTEANGPIVKLPPSDVDTTALTFTAYTIPQGTVISLIGGGGLDPLQVNSTQGAPTVNVPIFLLKNATPWTALKDAVLNVKFMSTYGGINYFIEVSRS